MRQAVNYVEPAGVHKFPWYVDEMSDAGIMRLPDSSVMVKTLYCPGHCTSQVLSSVLDLSKTVIKCIMNQGVFLSRHWHRQSEHILICSGELILECSGEALTLKQGDGATIDPGVPHSSLVAKSAVFLVTFTPALDYEWVSPDRWKRK